MRKVLTVLVAVSLLTIAAPAAAIVECPNPERPIHYAPLCLSEAEWVELTAPRGPEIVPGATGRPLVEALIVKYFPAWAVPAAVRVVGCETGYTYDPWSKNSYSGASGYFQHMPRYWSARSSAAGWAGYSIFHPEANVAVAAWLWGQTGTWAHWSCNP